MWKCTWMMIDASTARQFRRMSTWTVASKMARCPHDSRRRWRASSRRKTRANSPRTLTGTTIRQKSTDVEAHWQWGRLHASRGRHLQRASGQETNPSPSTWKVQFFHWTSSSMSATFGKHVRPKNTNSNIHLAHCLPERSSRRGQSLKSTLCAQHRAVARSLSTTMVAGQCSLIPYTRMNSSSSNPTICATMRIPIPVQINAGASRQPM